MGLDSILELLRCLSECTQDPVIFWCILISEAVEMVLGGNLVIPDCHSKKNLKSGYILLNAFF